VKRVLVRYFGIAGFPGEKKVENRLWQLAEDLLPAQRLEAYTQGLMDLGAGICTRRRPQCGLCPLQKECVARRQDRTEALPAPRPKKSLPQKHTVMLILHRDGEVLLEKRPAPGIWGGLWSFPEVAAVPEGEALCRSRFGAEVCEQEVLADVRHGFTHFNLTITPMLLQVLRLDARARQPDQIWLGLDDAIGAAVPAPVRMILHRLRNAA
jgi:A/G-specific adenine glycosylase